MIERSGACALMGVLLALWRRRQVPHLYFFLLVTFLFRVSVSIARELFKIEILSLFSHYHVRMRQRDLEQVYVHDTETVSIAFGGALILKDISAGKITTGECKDVYLKQ